MEAILTTASPTSDLNTVALAVGLAAASFTPGLIILIVIVVIIVCVMVRRTNRPQNRVSAVQRGDVSYQYTQAL